MYLIPTLNRKEEEEEDEEEEKEVERIERDARYDCHRWEKRSNSTTF